MKTILIIIVVLALVGVAIFFYKTRPIKFKETNLNNQIQHLDEAKTTSKILKLDSTKSEVSFALNEVLSGVPTHVVGTSSTLVGEVSVELQPAKLNISEIKIDARTLKTDIERRNSAIARFILESIKPGNEYITFKPIEIKDLPKTIEINKEFTYSITGDLTIKGTTKLITFQAKSLVNQNGSLSGSASSTLVYADFGVSVPNLSFLANVDKEVVLTINFLAK